MRLQITLAVLVLCLTLTTVTGGGNPCRGSCSPSCDDDEICVVHNGNDVCKKKNSAFCFRDKHCCGKGTDMECDYSGSNPSCMCKKE